MKGIDQILSSDSGVCLSGMRSAVYSSMHWMSTEALSLLTDEYHSNCIKYNGIYWLMSLEMPGHGCFQHSVTQGFRQPCHTPVSLPLPVCALLCVVSSPSQAGSPASASGPCLPIPAGGWHLTTPPERAHLWGTKEVLTKVLRRTLTGPAGDPGPSLNQSQRPNQWDMLIGQPKVTCPLCRPVCLLG